jgi:glucose-6-phosphate isomerase
VRSGGEKAMTRDELTQLAKEVGAELSAYINYHYDEVVVVFYKDQLERFAALIAAPLEEEIQDLKYQLKEARND